MAELILSHPAVTTMHTWKHLNNRSVILNSVGVPVKRPTFHVPTSPLDAYIRILLMIDLLTIHISTGQFMRIAHSMQLDMSLPLLPCSLYVHYPL